MILTETSLRALIRDEARRVRLVEAAEWESAMAAFRETLSPREKVVFDSRIAPSASSAQGPRGRSLASIGQELGIATSGVHVIEAKLKMRLRDFARNLGAPLPQKYDDLDPTPMLLRDENQAKAAQGLDPRVKVKSWSPSHRRPKITSVQVGSQVLNIGDVLEMWDGEEDHTIVEFNTKGVGLKMSRFGVKDEASWDELIDFLGFQLV